MAIDITSPLVSRPAPSILTPIQTSVADASIKNFLKGTAFPPTTSADRAKMKAAIESFKAQVKKTKEASAKKAGTAGKSGSIAATKSLAAQQTTTVGSSIPDISKFLPAGTNTTAVTFDAAINSMEATIKQLENLVKLPSSVASPLIANAPNQVQSLSTAGQLAAATQAAAAAAALIQPKLVIGGAAEFGRNANVKNV
jgi:hypothetical protein